MGDKGNSRGEGNRGIVYYYEDGDGDGNGNCNCLRENAWGDASNIRHLSLSVIES
jgi:hypothetical protein